MKTKWGYKKNNTHIYFILSVFAQAKKKKNQTE